MPYRPALFILEGGSPGVYTYRKPDLDIDVRHECTHALLHSALPVVPLWLDEGIAKYFEVPAEPAGIRSSVLRRPQMEVEPAAGDGPHDRVAGAAQRFDGDGRGRLPLLMGLGAFHAARAGSGRIVRW